MLFEGNGEDSVGIRAKHHEARLTEREQPGKAVEQVQGDGKQRIDGRLLDNGGKHGIVLLLINIDKQRNDHRREYD